MMLKDIVKQCAPLSIYEERTATDNYCEVVFYRKDIDEWTNKIASVMGTAVKPSGMKPSKEHLQLTNELGGIWAEQTLFHKQEKGHSYLAMFWPWQDKTHVTLKMFMQAENA